MHEKGKRIGVSHYPMHILKEEELYGWKILSASGYIPNTYGEIILTD